MKVEFTDIVYRYYPKDIYVSDPRYPSTPENVRQWNLIEDARKNKEDNTHYENMITELNHYLNCSSYEDFSLRGAFDLCRKSVLHLPKNLHHIDYPYCVICISIVTKFYYIYFTKFAGTPINTLHNDPITEIQRSLINNLISRIIKNHYKDYQIFPNELIDEHVPNIYSSKNYDQFATYFECLMTDDVI
jgi:hypothetical protein